MFLKKEIIKKIKKNPLLLKNYTNFQNDKDVVLTAVKNLAWTIHFASDRLKNDKDVVIEAVKKYGIELHDISIYSKKFMNDKQVVFAASINNYPN